MRVGVPVHLSTDRQLLKPVAVQFADLSLNILKFRYVLWQLLLLTKAGGCQGLGLDLVDDAFHIRPASRARLAEEAGRFKCAEWNYGA